MRVRAATLDGRDLAFLQAMGCEAASWHPARPRLELAAVLADPKLALYVAGWGRRGDYGVIAESAAGELVGAAWYRLFSDTDHGYGFLAPEVPELSIGVVPEERGRGIGTRLLTALIEHAREEGHPALSLSVEHANPAVRLYERLGFVRVAGDDDAATMRLDLV